MLRQLKLLNPQNIQSISNNSPIVKLKNPVVKDKCWRFSVKKSKQFTVVSDIQCYCI